MYALRIKKGGKVKYYTEEAYKVTVISPCEIEKRVTDQKTDVLVAIYNNRIVGKASIKMEEKGNLHIRSMAVKPNYQGKGIGWRVLEEINRLAKQRHCKRYRWNALDRLRRR